MLKYNNWSIEQTEWKPSAEMELQQQLSFSNSYLCQTAHFEEYYSQPQRLYTYVKDIEEPILNISSISVRLHDERLDLATWEVKEFYRCLFKNEPTLERRFIATSPKGHTLRVHARRQLLPQKELMQIDYEIYSVNYDGPCSLLAMLGDNNTCDKNWYPLMNHLDQNQCWLWLQMHDVDIQLCCAMNWQVWHNNSQIETRPIKIEKPHTIGYSLTLKLKTGDTCKLRKVVAVVDSQHHKKDHLISDAIACLTNW
jgi:maltose phosphorylase